MSDKTQRRLAAIVSADVVGYSRLMGRDEIGTLAALRAHRAELIDPKIAEFGGRVVKTMGDGLLLEFPSVVNATLCAIQIQEGMAERNEGDDEDQRITFRVGVNLGDIIIEGEDIFGDGVNIAARLQEHADPGGISISRRVHEDVRDRLKVRFQDAGEHTLKNIVHPIRIWNWIADGNGTPSVADMQRMALPLPDKLSIAVLPFDNMSGDPEQEYFSDGISEDIITDLSKISALLVVARNSSFFYKSTAIKIQQVGRDLGVRFVVEGSVRKSGNRVRITAQLIDVETGGHVWADRYDRELNDVFAVQDEITTNVVDALQLALLPDEARLVAKPPTSNFQAYDYYLKGRQCSHFMRTAKFIEAKQLYESAIECDPEFARAFCGIADCGTQLYFWEGEESYLEGVSDAIERALGIDPDLAEAHASMGFYLSLTGEKKQAEREFSIAVGLDSNLYEAHYYWGKLHFTNGELSKAATHFENAWKVSPRDPQTPGLLLGIYRDLGRPEDVKFAAKKALEIGLRKLELEPDNTRVCMSCAFAHFHLGEHSLAESMAKRAIGIDPSDKINYYNVACLYALMKQPETALDFLEEASRDADHLRRTIRNDGDFVSLRNHPRFVALIEI